MTNRRRHGQAAKAATKTAAFGYGINMGVSGALSRGKTFRPSGIGVGITAVHTTNTYRKTLKKNPKPVTGTPKRKRVKK